jgi:hypothetical protein
LEKKEANYFVFCDFSVRRIFTLVEWFIKYYLQRLSTKINLYMNINPVFFLSI